LVIYKKLNKVGGSQNSDAFPRFLEGTISVIFYQAVAYVHEMSITQGVVEICENAAAGKRILAVVLEIGELSNIIPESMEFCFEACTKDTLLDGASLVIERIPARGRCRECGAEFHVKAYYENCPSCGGYQVDILSGEELRVKELEVE
jgi:hydrogenase nickel incorporation protein HypA/HybF